MRTKEDAQVDQSRVTDAGSTGAAPKPTVPVGRHTRAVMLVSTSISPELRNEASAGLRPRPEYLVLEGEYGVELLDWSQVVRQPTRRTPAGSLRQVATALLRSRGVAGFLSDGEHLGLPMAAVLGAFRARPRHVLIAHRLTTPVKRRLLALPTVRRGLDGIVVHSQTQWESVVELGVPEHQVHLFPYGVDTAFWSPRDVRTEALVVSAGREHRDYATLATALRGLDIRCFVADGSTHSPGATRSAPDSWPPNMGHGSVSLAEVRDLYARATVVVVPLLETEFPAGITVVAEAMAMGKPVVVTATKGFVGALPDPDAVLRVPPGDAQALRDTILSLAADPGRCAELGDRARRVALAHHDVRQFSSALASLAVTGGPIQAVTIP
jgi:glycosyltransferase involved in cell wall biosynthesis